MSKFHFLGISSSGRMRKTLKNQVACAGGSKLIYITAGQFGFGANFDDSVHNFQIARTQEMEGNQKR